jgi:hypothetical protein
MAPCITWRGLGLENYNMLVIEKGELASGLTFRFVLVPFLKSTIFSHGLLIYFSFRKY